MKDRNFARSWLGVILALAGLAISLPASFYFQSTTNRTWMEANGMSLVDYLKHIPSFFGDDIQFAELGHTLAWTAIGFLVIGFGVGELIKLIIRAAQQPVATRAP